MKAYRHSMFLLLMTVFFFQCSSRINLFSIQDDMKFGQQFHSEIRGNSREYPILDKVKYARAYQILQRMTDQILNSGYIQHRNDFQWELNIIHDDKTLNAFVTPGGYIYVYTGLVKYLDTEDQLAGVMGHEIAHADRRHSTSNMTKQLGVGVLVELLAGQNTAQTTQLLGNLTGTLVGLSFSRDTEAEADAYSVMYLSKTEYACNGTAGFFEKIVSGGNSQEPPQFLSTHPNSANRVRDINNKAQKLGCNINPSGKSLDELKRSLP